LKGRAAELTTLARAIESAAPTRLALVGSGGSGKSMLAAALGHRMRAFFGGNIHWFRIGAWDATTLFEMLALHFGTTRERKKVVPALRTFLRRGPPRFVVLDNHEVDAATARVLDELSDGNATFVVTARRCLLAGVLVYPVTAPLVTAGKSAFPRVAPLTRALRWNPLALDVANAFVASRVIGVRALGAELARRGLGHVHVIEHEDDLPEVALLVRFAWERLRPDARRVLAVLAHLDGDNADAASLGALARCDGEAALALPRRWHLVQEPLAGRFALHAVVRHAIRKWCTFDAARIARHYVALLEREPERLFLEQTHLFGAMDWAHREGKLGEMLRIEELLRRIAP
jgi:hypothetical protein